VIISAKRRNVFGTIGDGCAEVFDFLNAHDA